MSTILLIITTYLVATLWEQYFHRDVLDASSKVIKRWKSSEFVLYQDDSKNFNLLWGGDWLRGTYLSSKDFRRSESPTPTMV